MSRSVTGLQLPGLALLPVGVALITLAIGPSAAQAADRALLIGIDDYSGSEVAAPDGRRAPIRNLQGARNDVSSVRRLLEDGYGVEPESIRELIDGEATLAGVLEGIDDWLIDGTRQGDRVFLHFSGHGSQVIDAGGDEAEDGLDEVLVTADARCLTDPSARNIARCENVLADDVLGERLDRLIGRHTLILVDSCHAGTSTRDLFGGGTEGTRLATFDLPGSAGTRSMDATGSPSSPASAAGSARGSAPPSMAGLVEQAPDRVALFAVAPGQLAAEVADEQQRPVGLFTDRLVRGVLEQGADANTDGAVSFAELLSHLKGESGEYCRIYPRHAACLYGGVDPQAEIDASLVGKDVLSFGRQAVVAQAGAPASVERPGEQPVVAQATSEPSVEPRVESPVEPPGADPGSDDAPLGPQSITASLPLRNEANLRVTLAPSTDFSLDQAMSVSIASDRAGMLMVLDRSAAGELVALYPRPGVLREPPRPDGRPLGWLRAGRSVLMPDAYSGEQWVMGEPFGSGTIVAVLAEDFDDVAPVIDALVNSSRAFSPVQRADAWLGELYQALERVVPDDSTAAGIRASRWSIATIDYTVNP